MTDSNTMITKVAFFDRAFIMWIWEALYAWIISHSYKASCKSNNKWNRTGWTLHALHKWIIFIVSQRFFPWIPNIADKVVVTCCVDFFDDVLVTPFKMSSHWSLPTLLSFVKFSSSCLGSIGVKRIFGLGLQLLRKDFPDWWLDCFSDWFSLGML